MRVMVNIYLSYKNELVYHVDLEVIQKTEK